MVKFGNVEDGTSEREFERPSCCYLETASGTPHVETSRTKLEPSSFPELPLRSSRTNLQKSGRLLNYSDSSSSRYVSNDVMYTDI